MLEAQVKVSVPLEIIADVDIETLVIDDEKLEIPFDIELNKEELCRCSTSGATCNTIVTSEGV